MLGKKHPDRGIKKFSTDDTYPNINKNISCFLMECIIVTQSNWSCSGIQDQFLQAQHNMFVTVTSQIGDNLVTIMIMTCKVISELALSNPHSLKQSFRLLTSADSAPEDLNTQL